MADHLIDGRARADFTPDAMWQKLVEIAAERDRLRAATSSGIMRWKPDHAVMAPKQQRPVVD